MMKKKMRGVIDPFTLGFLISFLGAGTVLTYENGQQEDTVVESSPAETIHASNIQTSDEGNLDVE